MKPSMRIQTAGEPLNSPAVFWNPSPWSIEHYALTPRRLVCIWGIDSLSSSCDPLIPRIDSLSSRLSALRWNSRVSDDGVNGVGRLNFKDVEQN